MRGLANKRSMRFKKDAYPSVVDHRATGATAGVPGSFTGGVPLDLGDLQWQEANSVSLGQTGAWTIGQSVVLQDATTAYWDGTSWAAGTAP